MYTHRVSMTASGHPSGRPGRRGSAPRSIALAAAFALALAAPPPVQAKTFVCFAGDVVCLRAAINEANANGDKKNTIFLDAGTYSLTDVDDFTDGPNGLPTITGALTITGAGAADTSIERSSAFFRLVHVAATGSLTLRELTVQGFLLLGGDGGGIRNDGTLTIINSTLTGNVGGVGGGIFNEGALTITGSTVSGNHGFFAVGGIYNTADGTVILSKSTLSGNTAGLDSGGVANFGTMTIIDSTFASNVAFDTFAHAGGIANFGSLTIAGSTLSNNAAGGFGGGIANDGSLTIINSSLSGNHAKGGGGIVNFGGTLTITNSTLSGNAAFFPGGGGIFNDKGVFNNGGTVTITNSTISGNTTFGGAGGIVNSDVGNSVVTVQNTILALNVSRSGAPDCSAVTSLGNNLIGTTMGCHITLRPSDLIGDPGLDTFTDDGTPGNGHYPLLPFSQPIDAGNGEVCPKRDQIGQKRHHPCDIGAIEFPDHP